MASSREYSDARVWGNLAFIKTTLNPRLPLATPPNLFHNSTFTQQLQIDGQITIGTDTVVGTERVPVSEGMIMWLVQRGMDSFWRMGFVPATAFSDRFNIAGGNATLIPSYNNVYGAGAIIASALSRLTFDTQLALPYTPLSERITLPSKLSKDFSRARMYSGILTAKSDTMAVGTVFLNGSMSAGVVADTRDVCQDTTTKLAFGAQDVALKSITPKDGITNTGITHGITLLQGPDINPVFTAPAQDSVDVLHGEWLSRAISMGGFFDGLSLAANIGVPVSGVQFFVTPWNITPTWPAGANFTQLIKVPAINECGILDFDIDWKLVSDKNGFTSEAIHRYAVVATHYFAQVNEQGGIVYQRRTQQNDLATVSVTEVNRAVGGIDIIGRTCFRPKVFATGFNDIGKYIGTELSLVDILVRADAANVNAIRIVLASSSCTVNVRARNILREGELSARVIRWVNLSPNQVIKVDGCVNMECVPQGAIAPYVQQNAMWSKTSMDLNLFPLVSELYDGPTNIQRVWRGEVYEDMVKKLLPNLNPQSLLKDAGERDSQLAAGMEAGGFFSGLGSILGNAVMPGMGGALGGLVGGLGDGVFGTSGRYVTDDDMGVPMNSAGQFGYQSAGQFGAAGRFGNLGSAIDGLVHEGSQIYSDMTAGSRRPRY